MQRRRLQLSQKDFSKADDLTDDVKNQLPKKKNWIPKPLSAICCGGFELLVPPAIWISYRVHLTFEIEARSVKNLKMEIKKKKEDRW